MIAQTRPVERVQNDAFAHLVQRIRSEFLEMPGLRLTLPQASRLWAVDRATSERILDTLTAAGFLSKNREGAYFRVSVT